MRVNFQNLFQKPLGIVLVISLLVIVLAILPVPWNVSIYDSIIDIQFKIRGKRRLANDIVFVFIGPNDIQAMSMDGKWPITRDYYGYMTHILDRLGAKVIGFDILFDTRGSRYQEYDTDLADFFKTSGNVVLPMVFSQLTEINTFKTHNGFLYEGVNPTLPIPELQDSAAGIGFSNLGNEVIVRKVPLAVTSNDSVTLSFGAELACLYLDGIDSTVSIDSRNLRFLTKDGKIMTYPLCNHGRLRINHFGKTANLNTISFVELMQAFQASPDSLNLSGKLVLVAVTSPGVSPNIVTPLSPALPAALIHATVAENLIHRNYLRELPIFFDILLICFSSISILLVWKYHPTATWIFLTGLCMIALVWLVAIVLFSKLFIILEVFYPTISIVAIATSLFLFDVHQKQRLAYQQVNLFESQIEEKQEQLELAETQLSKLQEKLDAEEIDANKIRIRILEKQIRDLRAAATPQHHLRSKTFPECIHAKTSKMVQVLDLVATVSNDDIPVLLLGETGTGKELIARAIHQSGKRKNAAFIAVNCGALPETLLESELFGHEKGSFSGAHNQRRGRFELANGGTLFLDEITETTPAFQTKLLRVLQEGTFERVGGEKTLKVNVRIIAASSRDLQTEIQQGGFRTDLYYRLNGFPISLPPLRERTDDILLLAKHFLTKYGYHSITAFSEQTLEILRSYRWPGNVRELENVIRRAAILAQSASRNMIQSTDLPKEMLEAIAVNEDKVKYVSLDQQILEMLQALKFSHNAISQTATALGNRDRGTITEYFRGICFENYVKFNFHYEKAARYIANSKDQKVVDRVMAKLQSYLKNLPSAPVLPESDQRPACFKGLPKKYHPYLIEIIEKHSTSV